ncbi:MAG: peptidylprolyl isomerase [Verrucomicrobia bacterium]|nr:peptidylprolyl isomerase [Verrucomicrobiota bacterium]
MLPRLLFALAALALAGCGKSDNKAAATAADSTGKPWTAVLQLEQGTIEFELLAADAPKAAENFRLLAERGFYNGLTFHRIVKDFMIQGGDPLGDGRGGESAWGGTFDDECQPRSPLYQGGLGYKRGIVAMANRGPNTNSSQFFIIHQDHPLPPSYTIFGRVTKGIEVVDAICALPMDRGGDGAMSKPRKPVVIQKALIRR